MCRKSSARSRGRKGTRTIFAGSNPGEALSVSTIDEAWRRVRTAARLPDVRLHGLRRTLGSWIVQQTGSLALVGALLNHSDLRVTAAHYARFADHARRKALEDHGNAILKVAGIANVRAIVGELAEVIPLRRS